MSQAGSTRNKSARKLSKTQSGRRTANKLPRAKGLPPGKKNNLDADFIAGALLYSLLASHRSEVVSELLASVEEN